MARDATLCVRAGTPPDPHTGALVPPLVQSTTYGWRDLDHPPAVTYARSGGANVQALERRLAALEGGADAVCFGSGLAATDAVLRLVGPGGRIVAGRHLYGGTTRLLAKFYAATHRVETFDSTEADALERALATPADLLLVETPSNPTLRVTDLARCARLARDAGALLVVDNTFLTPLYQKPLALGADIVLHSTTKYLDGHDATLGGALVLPVRHAGAAAAEEGPVGARLRWIRKSLGTVLAPFEAWLTLQGSKTLHLRTREQWSNAARLAAAAQAHPAVEAVHYPGLATHPQHALHRRQATGDGGILALDLGSLEAAKRFVSALRLFTLAENLGPTESLATHPATMTHADLAPQRRRADGIPDGLVRLSVGVEDPDDLVADLEGALALARRVAA